MEVTAGHRVTLTYNLLLAPGTSLLAGRPTSLDRETLPLVVNLRTMLANTNFMPGGGYIGIHLTHRYPHTHDDLNRFVPNMFKGVDMVVYKSVSQLNLPAILCTVSKSNIPPDGVLDSRDEMERRAARHPPEVRNDLHTFDTDENMDYESNYGDEERVQEAIDMTFGVGSDSEGSDVAPNVSDELLQWKDRFDDREMICWVKGAKHEEISPVFECGDCREDSEVEYKDSQEQKGDRDGTDRVGGLIVMTEQNEVTQGRTIMTIAFRYVQNVVTVPSLLRRPCPAPRDFGLTTVRSCRTHRSPYADLLSRVR